MRGGGGQNVIIVSSLDLVVVRLGHSRGTSYTSELLNNALELIVQALGVEQEDELP